MKAELNNKEWEGYSFFNRYSYFNKIDREKILTKNNGN
jgi:hypothetical protein